MNKRGHIQEWIIFLESGLDLTRVKLVFLDPISKTWLNLLNSQLPKN